MTSQRPGYQRDFDFGGLYGPTQELPRLDEPVPPLEGEPPEPPSQIPSIARNAIIVGVAFVASRALGVVREVAIAAKFGTSADYAAYVAAFRIPDLLFLIVMSGAFGSAFIPVFGGFLSRGDRQGAWRLASAILSYTLVVLAVASVLVFAFAGPLMNTVIAPGLGDESELAVELTRLLLLSPLLLGLGIAFKGMLEAQERFALAAFAPVFYNLGIIFGAVALTPYFGIHGLAFGVIVGAGLHAGLQFVGLARSGLRLGWLLDRATPGFSQVVRLMGPRVLGQAAFQINFIVMTNFASRLGTSTVGALNYAFQLFMLPYGVLALSLSTVIFPRLARQYEMGSIEEMKETLGRALAPLVFLSLPAAVGLLFFRTSIVQVLFQVGSFDEESTELVASALAYFAIGLLGFAIIEAVTRAFYAMQDTRTPVIVSVSAVAINVALSWLLSERMGYTGLALALSIASTVEAVVLVTILHGRIGGFSRRVLGSAGRAVVATALFAPVAYWMGNELTSATDPQDGRSLWTYLLFAYGLGTATLVYFAFAYLLGSPEIPDLVRRIPVVGRRIMPYLRYRYPDETAGR